MKVEELVKELRNWPTGFTQAKYRAIADLLEAQDEALKLLRMLCAGIDSATLQSAEQALAHLAEVEAR